MRKMILGCLAFWGWMVACTPGPSTIPPSSSNSGGFSVSNGGSSGCFDCTHNSSTSSGDVSSTSSTSGGVMPTWTALETPTRANLHAVATGFGGAFAVGDDGVILHFQNGFWAQQDSPTQEPLWGVWNDPNSTGAYAVGSNGTLLKYDGAVWRTVDLGATVALNAVWGASTNQVFVVGGHVGERGEAYSFDGAHWLQDTTSIDTKALFGVSGNPQQSTVWAVGENSTVYQRSGSNWFLASSGRTTVTLLGMAPTGGGCCQLAVGLDGGAMVYNNGIWQQDNLVPTRVALLGAAGLADGTALVTGERGLMLHRTANGFWTSESLPTTATLWGVAAEGNTALVVGDLGTAFFYH